MDSRQFSLIWITAFVLAASALPESDDNKQKFDFCFNKELVGDTANDKCATAAKNVKITAGGTFTEAQDVCLSLLPCYMQSTHAREVDICRGMSLDTVPGIQACLDRVAELPVFRQGWFTDCQTHYTSMCDKNTNRNVIANLTKVLDDTSSKLAKTLTDVSSATEQLGKLKAYVDGGKLYLLCKDVLFSVVAVVLTVSLWWFRILGFLYCGSSVAWTAFAWWLRYQGTLDLGEYWVYFGIYAQPTILVVRIVYWLYTRNPRAAKAVSVMRTIGLVNPDRKLITDASGKEETSGITLELILTLMEYATPLEKLRIRDIVDDGVREAFYTSGSFTEYINRSLEKGPGEVIMPPAYDTRSTRARRARN